MENSVAPRIWRAAAVLLMVVASAMPLPTQAQTAAQPSLTQVWSIDGTPLGTDRVLHPTIAANTNFVFISGSTQRNDRQHQVIRVFDAKTGRIAKTLENPSGEPFEGFGEAIAANDRFMVTSVFRRKGNGGPQGGVLVFDAQTGELLQDIQNPRAGDSDFFGQIPPVLVGDRILASVTLTNDNISSAWVFDAETGNVDLTIDEPDVPNSWLSNPKRSLFGRSLGMDENFIAIAATDRDGPSGLSAKGVVYVFDAKTGEKLHRLTTPASEKSASFGFPLKVLNGTLYATDLDETGPSNWPTGLVHAIDPATGTVKYTIADPFVPKTTEEILAGKTGGGLGRSFALVGGVLYLGLPDWSGELRAQGGVMAIDAASGKPLLRYLHDQGTERARFGHSLAAAPGGLVIALDFPADPVEAQRVIFFSID